MPVNNCHPDSTVPFSITAKNFEWISGQKDDPQDLCSHGDVSIQAGSECISYYCCTSAAALRMLRTLTEDRQPEDGLFGEQMLPCCGFDMYADETLENVTIIGCSNGIDYSVHHQDDAVILTLENGHAYTVSRNDYSREVLHFARQVEDFYASCSSKELPKEESERNGYTAFWNEWKRRMGNLTP